MPTAPDSAATGPVPPHRARQAIEVEHVAHSYGARQALDDVSLSVATGEMFALLGPNGGGKTTLFRIIATLLRPRAGVVRVFGADVAADSATVRRMLGVVFQAPALDRRLTIRENLRHQGHLYGLRGARLHTRLEEALTRVRVGDRADDRVASLSGGLARRAEIAKALLPGPRLLLLDEPTTGLDPGVREEIWRDLRTLRDRDGTTLVMTTHLMDEAEGCDRVGLLDRGRIVLTGRPADLTAALGGEIVAIESSRPEALAEAIRGHLGLPAQAVDGVVRIERDRAHELVGPIIEAFGGDVRAVRVSRPTLHDVFLHHTGRRFE